MAIKFFLDLQKIFYIQLKTNILNPVKIAYFLQKRRLAANYFRKKPPSLMFDSVLNTPFKDATQLIFTCSKLIIETIEKDVKYVQS